MPQQGRKSFACRGRDFDFAQVDDLGSITPVIVPCIAYWGRINHPLVEVEAIRNANFNVVVDGVTHRGTIPPLLDALGVSYHPLYCEPTGHFPHNPEPLKEHLGDLAQAVVEKKADFGIVVDPDVDVWPLWTKAGKCLVKNTLWWLVRTMYWENPGNTVSNLSSTRALRDVTEAAEWVFCISCWRSKRGDKNERKSGRDWRRRQWRYHWSAVALWPRCLVGIALFLSVGWTKMCRIGFSSILSILWAKEKLHWRLVSM